MAQFSYIAVDGSSKTVEAPDAQTALTSAADIAPHGGVQAMSGSVPMSNTVGGAVSSTNTTPAPTTLHTSTTPTPTADEQKLIAMGVTPDQIKALNDPSGNGLDPASFSNLVGNIETKLKTNNDLVTVRGSLIKHLYDSPLTADELAKLPPDIQQVVQSGNKDSVELQLRLINDQISGRANTLTQSIQYLTEGYNTAVSTQEKQKQDAVNAIMDYAQKFVDPATGQIDTTKLKAAITGIYGPQYASLVDSLSGMQPVGAYTSTLHYGTPGSGSPNVSIPSGTIASKTNNPLNIKYSSLMQGFGATDSGIAGQDGGTFSAFTSPQEGLNAAVKLLQSPTYSGLTIDQAMKKWSNSGYGAEVAPQFAATQKISSLSPEQMQTLVGDMAKRESGTSITAPTDPTQAYVTGIQNGTITSLAQVPAKYKAAVAQAMADQGISTPLSDRRFVMAANGIIANYISLPEYTLTANALPYILKIDAAKTIPGSVSDQELLDSFTKLSTAGGVISDAQVKVITNGQSLSDTLNIYSKRLQSGGVLSDAQRQQIFDLAQASYKNLKAGYQPIYDKATAQLKSSGIPEQYWTLPDLNALSATSEAAVNGTGGSLAKGSMSSSDYVEKVLTSQGISYNSALAKVSPGQVGAIDNLTGALVQGLPSDFTDSSRYTKL